MSLDPQLTTDQIKPGSDAGLFRIEALLPVGCLYALCN